MSDERVTTRSRENTRARLMEAAYEVFAEVGLDAASVEEICERAGFTRGAFYSNFESKDQLFLELVGRVSNARLEAVGERVRGLEAPTDRRVSPAELVGRLLDVEHDNRLGVLLLSEIRNRALRDPALAASYLQWDEAMTARVARLIGEIGSASALTFRMPVEDMARLFLVTWETAAQRAAMDGLDDEALCAAVNLRMQALAEALVG